MKLRGWRCATRRKSLVYTSWTRSKNAVGYDEVDSKTDNEVSTIAMKATRIPLLAKFRIAGFYEHEDLGPVERMQQTIQGQVRAIQLELQERTKTRHLQGTVICPWLVRHACWA